MTTPQTPHESPSSHLGVDTLADLQEGLLEVEQATAVAAHLDDCAECRVTRDALDDVRILLRDRGEQADVAAPDDVVRRLDDALAAAVSPAVTASTTVTPFRSSTAPGRQPWRTRVLQAAAVFVLVAAVGGIGYGGIRALNGGSGADAGTAASSGGNAQTEKGARADVYKITSSGRDYTDDSLRAALPQLLAGTLRAPAGGTPTAVAPSASPGAVDGYGSDSAASPQRLLDGTALAACVANLTGGPVTPLAVDVARFEKKPATIIVLPDQDDPSFVNVYAVAPNCPTGTFLSWQHVALP
jgi:hypothetical protein